jgi:hypothetical protein
LFYRGRGNTFILFWTLLVFPFQSLALNTFRKISTKENPHPQKESGDLVGTKSKAVVYNHRTKGKVDCFTSSMESTRSHENSQG